VHEVVERILKVSIEEFSEKGYAAASTNSIAKKAKVAKGLLFHYFKSKENLYIECYKHVLSWSKKKFEQFAKQVKNEDFFEFIKKWGLQKITLAIENPVYSKFLLTVTNLPPKPRAIVQSMIREVFADSSGILLEKIKSVKLRRGISEEDALKFIMAVFDGAANSYLDQYRDKPEELLNNLEKIMVESDNLMDLIKFGILDRAPQ
jgi:TetR/AcrR family transcriptional regulator